MFVSQELQALIFVAEIVGCMVTNHQHKPVAIVKPGGMHDRQYILRAGSEIMQPNAYMKN